MTKTDLVIEALAGAVAAIGTSLLMDRLRPAPRISAAEGADPQSPTFSARLVEGIAGFVAFRGLMAVVRRTGQAAA